MTTTPMTPDLKTPSLVERLRSRAWEHRYHRQYREEAAAEIDRLSSELATLTQRLEGVERENAELKEYRAAQIDVLMDVHAEARDAQTLVTSLSEALRELVRIDDAKKRFAGIGRTLWSERDDAFYAEWDALSAKIGTHKEAMDAARKLVALPDNRKDTE